LRTSAPELHGVATAAGVTGAGGPGQAGRGRQMQPGLQVQRTWLELRVPGTLNAAGAAGAAGIQEKEETISCLLFSVNPKTNLTYEKNSIYVITIIVP